MDSKTPTQSPVFLDLEGFKKHPVTLSAPTLWSGAKLLQDGNPPPGAPEAGRVLLKRDDRSEVTAKLAGDLNNPKILIDDQVVWFSYAVKIPGFERNPVSWRQTFEIVQNGKPVERSGKEYLLVADDGTRKSAIVRRSKYGNYLVLDQNSYSLARPSGCFDAAFLTVMSVAPVYPLMRLTAWVGLIGLFASIIGNGFILALNLGTGFRIALSILFSSLLVLVPWVLWQLF